MGKTITGDADTLLLNYQALCLVMFRLGIIEMGMANEVTYVAFYKRLELVRQHTWEIEPTIKI